MANLITIDQLLESVDLDFEPRFVTKDKSGVIAIWSEKPEKVVANRAWVGQTEFIVIPLIKLADFENKDWQECIYEVPRKTTGKIEKLDKITIINHSTEAAFDMSVHYWLNEIIKKQGELVDAVNKHEDIIRQIGQWGSNKGEFLWCETLTKFEPNELKGAKNE